MPDEVPDDECRARRPDLVVLSTVNGHGHQDGLRVIRRLRAAPELAGTPIVIGGKLGIDHDRATTRGMLVGVQDAGFLMQVRHGSARPQRDRRRAHGQWFGRDRGWSGLLLPALQPIAAGQVGGDYPRTGAGALALLREVTRLAVRNGTER